MDLFDDQTVTLLFMVRLRSGRRTGSIHVWPIQGKVCVTGCELVHTTAAAPDGHTGNDLVEALLCQKIV